MSDNVGFKGVIKTSMADSTPWWPDQKRPPEGAPNILYVVLDDTGYSQLGVLRLWCADAKYGFPGC